MRTATTRRLTLSSLLAASALSLAACSGSPAPSAATSTVTASVAAPSSTTAGPASTTTAGTAAGTAVGTTSTPDSEATAAGARPARTESAAASRPTSGPATASTTSAPGDTTEDTTEDAPDQGSDRVIALGGSSGHDKGFGWSRPSRVYLGGDPTGDLTGITWDGWGLDVAEGTGTSMYVPEGKSVAQAVRATARVRAWAPGKCHGKVAYTKVAWWFPSYGQTGPVDVIDACR